MRQFKVKTTSVSGGGNKIYKSGEIVGENGFNGRHVDELVAKGFLELVINKAAPVVPIEKIEPVAEIPVVEESPKMEIPKASKSAKAISDSI